MQLVRSTYEMGSSFTRDVAIIYAYMRDNDGGYRTESVSKSRGLNSRTSSFARGAASRSFSEMRDAYQFQQTIPQVHLLRNLTNRFRWRSMRDSRAERMMLARCEFREEKLFISTFLVSRAPDSGMSMRCYCARYSRPHNVQMRIR